MKKGVPLGSPRRLADGVYKELERLIVTTEISPGEWVTEESLGRRLSVSRTPVREALQRLARARLLEIVPRRGLRITDIDVKNQLLLLDVRKDLERHVSVASARRATPEQIEQFKALAIAMTEAGRRQDVEAHYRVDIDYKLLLLGACRNEYAADAITPLWTVSRRFAWFTRAARNIKLMSELTAATMRAIAKRDEHGAAMASDRYVEGLRKLARSWMESQS
jgi:DNA-binding GntR family transcriptional regulator